MQSKQSKISFFSLSRCRSRKGIKRVLVSSLGITPSARAHTVCKAISREKFSYKLYSENLSPLLYHPSNYKRKPLSSRPGGRYRKTTAPSAFGKSRLIESDLLHCILHSPRKITSRQCRVPAGCFYIYIHLTQRLILVYNAGCAKGRTEGIILRGTFNSSCCERANCVYDARGMSSLIMGI